jgi:hypothetical protein
VSRPIQPTQFETLISEAARAAASERRLLNVGLEARRIAAMIGLSERVVASELIVAGIKAHAHIEFPRREDIEPSSEHHESQRQARGAAQQQAAREPEPWRSRMSRSVQVRLDAVRSDLPNGTVRFLINCGGTTIGTIAHTRDDLWAWAIGAPELAGETGTEPTPDAAFVAIRARWCEAARAPGQPEIEAPEPLPL